MGQFDIDWAAGQGKDPNEQLREKLGKGGADVKTPPNAIPKFPGVEQKKPYKG